MMDGLLFAKTSPIVVSIGIKGDADGDGEVSASDVQTAFDISLSRINANTYQRWAADVNRDQRVTAMDVQLVFELALGRDSATALTGKRIVLPAEQTADHSLIIETLTGIPGESVSVPIVLQPGKRIRALTIDVLYHPAFLSFTRLHTLDTLLNDFGLADAHEIAPGHVRISAAALSAEPIRSSGVLANLVFQIERTKSGHAPITVHSTHDDLEDIQATSGGIDLSTQVNWMVH